MKGREKEDRTRHSIWNIRNKMFLSLVLVILTSSLLIGYFASYATQRETKQMLETNANELLDQIRNVMEDRMQTVLDTSYQFMTNSEVLLLMEGNEPVSADTGQKIFRRCGSVQIGLHNIICSVYAKSSVSQETFWWQPGHSKEPSNEKVEHIVSFVENYLEEHDLRTCWIQINGDIYLGRVLIPPTDIKKNLGVLIFQIDTQVFEFVAQEDGIIKNNNLVFHMRKHDLFFTIGTEDTLNQVEQYVKQNEASLSHGTFSVSHAYQDEEYILSASRHSQSYWDIYAVIQMSTYADSQKHIALIILSVCIFAGVLSILVAFCVAGGMTKNLQYLSSSVKKLEQGDFRIKIKTKSKDEIGQLCESFNYMADKISLLMDKAYEDGKRQEKLEYQLLKAQINPHFVYNSLGSIRSLANINKEPEISEMVTALINLLRISLGKEGRILQMSDEIQYIKNYFEVFWKGQILHQKSGTVRQGLH